MEVDARLAPDGGIDRTKECGGHIDEGDSALECGGTECTEIGDDSTTDVDHEGAARGAGVDKGLPDIRGSGESLGCVAGGNDDAWNIGEQMARDGGYVGICDYMDRSRTHRGQKPFERVLHVVGVDDLLHVDCSMCESDSSKVNEKNRCL